MIVNFLLVAIQMGWVSIRLWITIISSIFIWKHRHRRSEAPFMFTIIQIGRTLRIRSVGCRDYRLGTQRLQLRSRKGCAFLSHIPAVPFSALARKSSWLSPPLGGPWTQQFMVSFWFYLRKDISNSALQLHVYLPAYFRNTLWFLFACWIISVLFMGGLWLLMLEIGFAWSRVVGMPSLM